MAEKQQLNMNGGGGGDPAGTGLHPGRFLVYFRRVKSGGRRGGERRGQGRLPARCRARAPARTMAADVF